MRIPVLVLAIVVCAYSAAFAQDVPSRSIDAAIGAVYPSLVRISVVTTEHTGGREVRIEGSGSGTIITPDGFVVTNHHVAGRAMRIVCTLWDRHEIPADLVGTDPLSDIAVLRLRPPSPRTFSAARFGDSGRLAAGDAVLALGSPLALSQSVTLGIVSNTEMVMPRTIRGGLNLEGEDVGSIVRWIAHDAAIYPGNSGGPLVNLNGEIVGVNEISFGLAGAIPGNLAKAVADALIRDGRVRRSWTGLELQPTLKTDKREGALVAWVADGSPADRAGIRSGDLLERVNDQPVNVRFAEELPLLNQLLAGLPIGETIPVQLSRATGPVAVSLTPVERSAALARPSELGDWGMVGANLTETEARRMARTSTEGVRVVSLRSGGPAERARPPLQRDDVVVELEGQRVSSVADLQRVTAQLLAGKPRLNVLVAFERGEERRLAIMELSEPRIVDPALEARRASLPILVQVLTPPLAERLGLKGRTGVRITRVLDSAMPLRVGDVVLAIDDAPVTASSPTDEEAFGVLLRQFAVGSSVTLTISRDGNELPVQVVLPPAPRLPREMRRYEDAAFGFRARDLAEGDRLDPRLRGTSQGVVIDAVEQGGWAALARLGVGDVIIEADGNAIADVENLAVLLKAAAQARQPVVVLKVRRGVRTMYVELEPAWQ